GLGRRRLLGLADGGVTIELVRVFVDDLRAVPGGEHDGVAVAVPAGEPGRAGPAGLAGLDEVSGTADEVVARVGLEFLDALVDVDVVVLLLEILDLVGLLRNADVELAAVGTVGVDAFDSGQCLLDLSFTLKVQLLRAAVSHSGRGRERAAQAESRSGTQPQLTLNESLLHTVDSLDRCRCFDCPAPQHDSPFAGGPCLGYQNFNRVKDYGLVTMLCKNNESCERTQRTEVGSSTRDQCSFRACRTLAVIIGACRTTFRFEPWPPRAQCRDWRSGSPLRRSRFRWPPATPESIPGTRIPRLRVKPPNPLQPAGMPPSIPSADGPPPRREIPISNSSTTDPSKVRTAAM